MPKIAVLISSWGRTWVLSFKSSIFELTGPNLTGKDTWFVKIGARTSKSRELARMMKIQSKFEHLFLMNEKQLEIQIASHWKGLEEYFIWSSIGHRVKMRSYIARYHYVHFEGYHNILSSAMSLGRDEVVKFWMSRVQGISKYTSCRGVLETSAQVPGHYSRLCVQKGIYRNYIWIVWYIRHKYDP